MDEQTEIMMAGIRGWRGRGKAGGEGREGRELPRAARSMFGPSTSDLRDRTFPTTTLTGTPAVDLPIFLPPSCSPALMRWPIRLLYSRDRLPVKIEDVVSES